MNPAMQARTDNKQKTKNKRLRRNSQRSKNDANTEGIVEVSKISIKSCEEREENKENDDDRLKSTRDIETTSLVTILLVIANITFQTSFYSFTNYNQKSSASAQRSNQQIVPEQREESSCFSESMGLMGFNYYS